MNTKTTVQNGISQCLSNSRVIWLISLMICLASGLMVVDSLSDLFTGSVEGLMHLVLTLVSM